LQNFVGAERKKNHCEITAMIIFYEFSNPPLKRGGRHIIMKTFL
jgi:hypothetical protein